MRSKANDVLVMSNQKLFLADHSHNRPADVYVAFPVSVTQGVKF